MLAPNAKLCSQIVPAPAARETGKRGCSRVGAAGTHELLKRVFDITSGAGQRLIAVRILSESSGIKLAKPEKLLAFSGQKRWIFLPGIGSPGKVWHDRTLEVVGSTPIGSTTLRSELQSFGWQAIFSLRQLIMFGMQHHLQSDPAVRSRSGASAE